MRPFLWRIVICLAPVLLAGYEVAVAYDRFEHGHGGFRLGVDLVGGTVLTYEIDKEKTAAAGQSSDAGTDKLAEALKRRIDPADLLNVTIRPVGAERVEIVLPTGSTKQT